MYAKSNINYLYCINEYKMNSLVALVIAKKNSKMFKKNFFI